VNNKTNEYYANLTILVTGIMVLVSFLAFPYVDVLGQTATALQLITGMSLAGVTPLLVMVMPLVGLIAVISGGIALGNPSMNRTIAYVNFGAGIVLLLYLLYDLFQLAGITGGNAGVSVAMSVMGFGYWLMLLASFVLIGQIFVARQAGGSASVGVPPPLPGQQYMAQPTNMPRQNPNPAPPPIAPSAGPTQLLANAWLVNVQTQQSHQLAQGESRIGRSKSRNNVILGDTSVSREHAMIRQANGQFILYEVGARQPIFVNGQPVRGQHVLQPNDQVTMGNVHLRFVRG